MSKRSQQTPTIHRYVAETEEVKDKTKRRKRRLILATIGLVLAWLLYELVHWLFF